MSFDLILQGGVVLGHGAVDLGLRGGHIAAIGAGLSGGPVKALDGALVTPGLIETHIHLDKSCLSVPGADGLADAIAKVSALKAGMSVEDIMARARRTLERCILQGTTRMRTHVEVDPSIGLRGIEAVKRLREEYAWAIDIEICVFPQEGLFNRPGTEALLIEALEGGAEVLGGCSYADSDPGAHLRKVFELAVRFDVDLDLHLDFDLDPMGAELPDVCALTVEHGMQGRVSVGHVTKLSALPEQELAAMAEMMREAGVAAVILPATDLFLTGRGIDHNVPRGVAPAHRLAAQGVCCCLSTNNVLNPFTPFGDGSLMRIANLFANVAQVGDLAGLEGCFGMISAQSARVMRLPAYGLEVGGVADMVVFDAGSAASAVAEIAVPLLGIKRGRVVFEREKVGLKW